MSTSLNNIPIIDFFETVLGVTNLSPIQKITLKVIRGEPLDTTTPIPKSHDFQERGFENEVDMFLHFSGKKEYIAQQYSDASLVFGRRSGKTCTLGAGLTIYYATQFDYKPYLGTSPHATIPLISATKDQAGEVYAAIKGFFLRSPWLFQKFLDGKVDNISEEYSEDDMKNPSRITGGQIRLNNKVVIKVMAADVSKIRGMAVPIAVLDEINFFGVEGNDTKNTDIGIFEALSPALSQFTTVDGMALVLKISSPNGQAGLMYGDYLKREEVDTLHIQVPTWYSNPSIGIRYLEKQKKKGLNYFNREYGAEYTSSESSYLDVITIERAVLKGVVEIPPQKGMRYAAAIDYASKHDYWTFAIGHQETHKDPITKEEKTRVFIDHLAHWKGSDGAELNPEEIVPEITNQLKRYSIPFSLGDQYGFGALKPYFAKDGCILKEFTLSNTSKIKMFYSLQVSLNSDSLGICSNPIAIQQLKDLRERRSNISNKIQISAASNSHDDYPIVIALVVHQFDKTSPIYIGEYDTSDDELEPSSMDASGKFINTPTAIELADFVGLSDFHDARKEKESEKDEPEDPDGFWFTI